jgi:diguanylate cyclase (GGDEF)-like protein/PAS domain S-box-containing protein
MKLADYISVHMEQILQEWQEYAQTLHAAKQMNQVALRDHAKQMLDSIAKDLATSQTRAQELSKSKGLDGFQGSRADSIDATARVHGLSRFGAGFTIEDLVSEYRALRASVLRLWGKCAGTAQQSDIDDISRFNEAIDQALAESVAVYAVERNQQVRLFETILSSSPDPSYILDMDGKFVYANKSLADQFNMPVHQMLGKTLFDLRLASAKELHEQIQQVIHTKQMLRGEILYGSKLGKHSYYEYIFTPVLDRDGRVEAVTGTAREITERKASEDAIWHKANYDLVTGLPNRRLFRDRFEQEIKHSERTGMPVALFFIDLDRFKEANDMLGHDAGDMLLQQAAQRIRSCIREKDTVARMGGDEFTVILTEFDEMEHVQAIANKILGELANPFFILHQMIHISGSIGITIFPRDIGTAENLVRNADQAMYVAKNAGRNQFSFFSPNMHEAAQMRYKLIADLRLALPQQQLVVHYQPVIDLSNGQIRKAEALLRWAHPEFGLVQPGEFIKLAEETGCINDIGNWIFTEAAMQSKIWQELLGMPFQISINKSAVEFMSHHQDMNWEAYMKQLGLPRNSISIEITEGVILHATGETTDKLASMQQAGIQLSIDDFGTGYSSMAYLNKFDVDFLKIDPSFVHNMATDANSRTIAETIIVMAHKLGLKVIAEGVETAAQRDWLAAAGCDYAQGFLFSEPVSAESFTRLLETDRISI